MSVQLLSKACVARLLRRACVVVFASFASSAIQRLEVKQLVHLVVVAVLASAGAVGAPAPRRSSCRCLCAALAPGARRPRGLPMATELEARSNRTPGVGKNAPPRGLCSKLLHGSRPVY